MIEARRLTKEIVIPEGVEVTLGELLTIKKGKNAISKKMSYPTIEIKIEGNKIIIIPKKFTKNEKKHVRLTAGFNHPSYHPRSGRRADRG